MPAPTYSDIVRYAQALRGVSDAAADAFLAAAAQVDFADWPKAAEELRGIVQRVSDVYGLAAQNLAGQWYDYCEELATGRPPERPAGDTAEHSTRAAADVFIDRLFDGRTDEQGLVQSLRSVVTDQVKERAADEIGARCMERRRSGRETGFARVPVGDTCAYCVMLASRGFEYVSAKTAARAGHSGCNCVVVPFHDAATIPGYEEKLQGYRDQYQSARDALRDPSPELQRRLDEAKAQHDADYAAGRTKTRWGDGNRITLAMRYAGDERGFRDETAERERLAASEAEKAVPRPQTDRERLEAQARDVYVRNGGGQGLSAQEADERFWMLVDGNTDAQLRQYIRKYG